MNPCMKIPVMRTINVLKKYKISLNQYSSSTFFFHDEDDACDWKRTWEFLKRVRADHQDVVLDASVSYVHDEMDDDSD